MSALITLDRLAAATPDGRPLFQDLTLSLGRQRLGIVGRNGAGKSTLLRLIAGEAAPAAGAVGVNGRIGQLRQALAPPPGATLGDLLGVDEALRLLARIEAGEGRADDFADADWTLPARIEAVLAEVGLEGVPTGRPATALSGGQATRAALAGLLLAEPDVLLLDEPTNNLDAEARGLIAELLARWDGAAVVVSHDRALLRRMDQILDLSPLGPRLYGGGYDLYAERRAQEQAAAEREYDTAKADAARVDREAQAARERQARRDAAGRRFAAKRSEPKILLGAMAERAENSGARGQRLAEKQKAAAAEALEAASGRVEQARRMGFDLPPSGLPAGRTVLAFEDVGYGWPDGTPVLRDLSFRIVGPERLAVAGPNGSGKTTLIRLAVGDLEPTAGQVLRGGPAVLLDQRAAILRDDETILEAFRRLHPGASRNAAQAALARFLFRNSAADQAVGSLSGGERLRAALAATLAGPAPPQLLILDEPTNHLDLASTEAIESALAGYDGALMVVSHDEDFLAAIGVDRRLTLA